MKVISTYRSHPVVNVYMAEGEREILHRAKEKLDCRSLSDWARRVLLDSAKRTLGEEEGE